MNAAEVGQVADEVELVSDNTKACVLQHAKTWNKLKKKHLLHEPKLNQIIIHTT